ncbi:hypothetical protein NQ314_002741, partial [Rhamnusium bicolor]
FLIPQRYVLGIMGFLAVVNAYTMRISLSIAITEMVASSNATEYEDPDACPAGSSNSSSASVTDTNILYDWDETTQGLILSSFYWGYVLTHLPGGILAEKFGGKYSLGLGILSTAIFTLVTPWGTTYPALNALLAKWVPLGERAKIGTLVYAGGQIGTIVSNSISGALINATKDWASVFYLFGAGGLLWFIIWVLICYSDPESHPFISDKEKAFLKKELENVSSEKKTIPWRAMLTSAPLWALVAAQIGHDWGFFTMVTDLPKYMSDVLKFNVKENGLWSSVPYIVMWIVSMGSGWLSSVGPAIFIMVASYSGCDKYLTVGMFTIAMGFMGTFYCGMKVNALDLSPNYAGTLMAIHTLIQWRTVFWISFAVFNFTNLIYCIFGSGEEQWWNIPQNLKNQKLDLENNSEEKKPVKVEMS